MADDDRHDLVRAHEGEERGEVTREIAPLEDPERLRGKTQGVGERDADANGAEVEAERPAAYRQCEPGGFGWSPLGTSLAG